MNIIDIGLLIIIGLLFAERWWDKRHMQNMQDMLNRALIAKSVPEYEATAESEIKKMKVENENARLATETLERYADQEDRRIPIT